MTASYYSGQTGKFTIHPTDFIPVPTAYLTQYDTARLTMSVADALESLPVPPSNGGLNASAPDWLRQVDDRVAGLLEAGLGITTVYDPNLRRITISATYLTLQTGSDKADVNAATLQAAIDNAHANGGGVVRLAKQGIYYCAKIVLKSNVFVVADDGVNMVNKTNANTHLVTNAAYGAAPIQVSSATYALSAGRLLATIDTAAAHGLVVGDYFSLVWTSSKGFSGVFKVVSKPSNTRVTCYLDIMPAVSAAAIDADAPHGYIELRRCDRNFGVIGGSWDWGSQSSAADMDSCLMVFGHTQGRQLQNVSLKVAGGKYLVWTASERDDRAENVWCDGTSDGFKLFGPRFGSSVKGIYGSCGDDVVSIQADVEATYRSIMPTKGDCLSVTVHDIFAYGTSGCSVYQGGGSGFAIRGIVIDGVHGGKYRGAMLMGTPSTGTELIEGVTFRNISIPVETFQLEVQYCTVGNLVIDGLECQSTFANNSNPAIKLNSATVRNMAVRNARNTYGWGMSGGSSALVRVPSGSTIGRLTVDGFEVTASAGYYCALDVQGGGVVKTAEIANVRCNCVLVQVAGTVTNLVMRAIEQTAGNICCYVPTGTVSRLMVDGLHFSGTYGAIVFESAGATGQVFAKGINCDNGGSQVVIGAGTTVALFADDVTIDVGTITSTVAGQRCIHASSVSGRNAAAQQGPAIRANGHWHAIATGASSTNTQIV